MYAPRLAPIWKRVPQDSLSTIRIRLDCHHSRRTEYVVVCSRFVLSWERPRCSCQIAVRSCWNVQVVVVAVGVAEVGCVRAVVVVHHAVERRGQCPWPPVSVFLVDMITLTPATPDRTVVRAYVVWKSALERVNIWYLRGLLLFVCFLLLLLFCLFVCFYLQHQDSNQIQQIFFF